MVRLPHFKGNTEKVESVLVKGSTKTKDLEISVKWLIKLEMFYRERVTREGEKVCVYGHGMCSVLVQPN